MARQPSRLIGLLYGLVPLVVAASVLFVLFVVGGKAVQSYELHQEARATQRGIDQLKRENHWIEEELERYRGDEFIEEAGRAEGLVRSGEIAVILVPADDRRLPTWLSRPTPTPAAEDDNPNLPVWQRWLALFVGQD